MKTRQLRIIFCPNQITISVAFALAQRDGNTVGMTIIYWPNRCDAESLLAIGVKCIPYSRLACLLYLLKRPWKSHTEVLLPHRKLGRFINWFSLFCSSTAIVDDGLDTFRDKPRNIDPALFKPGSAFYTFQYQTHLGSWLDRFAIYKIANLEAMSEVNREIIDLTRIKRLIIESPPLSRAKHQLGLDERENLFIRHSNINKRVICDFSCRSIIGSDIALEKSLRDFGGEIVVGESMAAVFALMQKNPKYRLTVYLSAENFENLKPLVMLIRTCDFAEFKLC